VRCAIVASVVVLAASAGSAQQRSERTFSLQADSAADCPAIETFSRRVLARTPRAAPATGKADVAFVLSVEVSPEGAAGTLEVVEGDARSRRSVRGASCEEVVDALALIAAVTLDPDASTAPIAIEPSQPAPPTKPEATSSIPAPSPSARPSSPRVSQRAARGSSWRLGAGVRGMFTEGLAPDPLFGFGVFASARLAGEGSVFEPTVLVGGWLARSGEFDATVGDRRLGTAQFRWLAGDIMGCVLRLPAEGTFAARPCLGFEAGQLTGKGRAAANSAEESATWLAVTANAKLDWVVFERLQLDLIAGGFLPLSRDEFFFEPAPGAAEGVVVHEVPPVGLRAWIGLSTVFP
jgi:hypothetical protein